jgi:hypothetical protein
MRVVLRQPNQRSADGRSHVRRQARSLLRMKDAPTAEDVVVLPELVGGEVDREEYVQDVQWLSPTANTWVVSGSHFRREGGPRINCDPPSFQWTPMLAFRSWRGVSDEREAPCVSGAVQARGG